MNSMIFMREDGQMGTCRICGKNFGLMGGGSEPYTGHNLQVCNSCGEVLKKIDKVKNEDTQEVKDLFVSVMSMTDDADVKRILTEYSKSVISDSEKLVAITNESKEKAERAQNIEENFYDLEKAFKVTTGYDFEGYQIMDYKGIVSGDIVLGTGFISEFAASWSDAFGTTSNTFAGKMKTAKQKALKQLSYYYDDGMKSRELEEVFIILSVIGQISIDLAKKEFNLNVGREIKRIRNLPCMNKKFVPQFFADTKKRRNNKDFENVKRMNCPMDIMAEMIEQQTGYSERVSHVLIRELFNKKIKGKANKYKFNKLIEESKKYNDTVKILASSKRKGRLEDDELYKLKRRQMELFLRKASKNLDQITIIQLVNHALMDSNSDVMGTLLNFLYFNYREKFLNCFVKNS